LFLKKKIVAWTKQIKKNEIVVMCKRVGSMSFHSKILNALKKAKKYLKSSIRTKENAESFKKAIWHAAAELEYALFFFSIKFSDENKRHNWRVNPRSKESDLNLMLSMAEKFLSSAEKCVLSEDMLEAYKNAYLARNYMLKIQGALAKKKSDASKKK